MADTLTPLLLDAKKEYTMRLSEIMSPFVIQFIDTTYRTAKKEVGDRKALIEFQERLRQVPSWNSSIITQYTHDIEHKHEYFADLMAAVFVTYVKVLSSIKISSQRPNIKLKLPSSEAFVHQVYVFTARNFYENPYAVKESQQTKAALVLNAIEGAVRNMLPLGDVLQAYLSSAVNDDNTVNPVLSPAQSDDEEEQHPEVEEAVQPLEEDSESDFEEGEEKIIQQPVISPINHPFPSNDTSNSIPNDIPTGIPQIQPPQDLQSFQPPQPPQPNQFQPPQTPIQPPYRPLFADATEGGEHHFR